MVGCSMVKEKGKGNFYGKTQGYTSELGSEILQQLFSGNSTRNACWYFLTHTEIIRKRMELPL